MEYIYIAKDLKMEFNLGAGGISISLPISFSSDFRPTHQPLSLYFLSCNGYHLFYH